MNFEQLRQLDAVARLGTISAAATRLRISQPALSRSLARLESELGAQLLDRRGKSVAMSAAGEA
ncbi:LysR family transcriptional regulator, partial [Slackia equolifaciens]